MEKLLIKNFAGLKEVEIEVKPITGFIGPQASGKSIIAKLLYFFREIPYRLPNAAAEGMDNAHYITDCRNRFVRYFPIKDTGDANFDIAYSANSESIRVVFAKNRGTSRESLNLEWTGFFSNAIGKFKRKKQSLFSHSGKVDEKGVSTLLELKEEYHEEASKTLGPGSKYEQIFIPAGRGFFSQVSATIFTAIEEGQSLDPFMVAFGSQLERSKGLLDTASLFNTLETPNAADEKLNRFLRSTFKNILNAEIVWSEKQYFLRFDDGRVVKLAQASSGQQEVLPFLLLLARFLLLGSARGRSVYIEEPEAHVYPSTQKQIVEFIARVFRARQRKMRLVITTHSPYILTSLNNLLQAGKLYEGGSGVLRKRLEDIVPLSQILKSDEVGFYALENGMAKSIIDSETGLIDAAVIDGVSDEIATQFDELLMEGNEKH